MSPDTLLMALYALHVCARRFEDEDQRQRFLDAAAELYSEIRKLDKGRRQFLVSFGMERPDGRRS